LKKGTLGEGMPPKSNSEWKAWRIQLASSNPGLNKAGRPYGKGTTSKARARRGRASEEEEDPPTPHQTMTGVMGGVGVGVRAAGVKAAGRRGVVRCFVTAFMAFTPFMAFIVFMASLLARAGE
jgi:hypothetical protein